MTRMIILGATGDLTRRLLMPALYRLSRLGRFPDLEITGYSKERWDDERFRKHIHDSLRDFAAEFDEGSAERFCAALSYLSGGLEAGDMRELAARTNGPALFYLALPPALFGKAAEALSQAGLAESSRGWRRLVVEKPFGYDLASAESLRVELQHSWPEENILRIDHFLGKESTQNLLVFRFANRFLEPLWNNAHIEQVQISCPETLGVEHRAAYYDHAGALRDMLQNHLMQLFCLTAMEPPSSWDAEVLRDHKVEVLRAVQPYSGDTVAHNAVRGQYTRGSIAGSTVAGYREEPGVASDSNTETFAALRFEVNNRRWEGVPFYLRSGKRLAGNASEIAVEFKRIPGLLPGSEAPENNWMVFRLQPQESLNLVVNAKVPGAGLNAHQLTLSAPYTCDPDEEFSAYEQLLMDALEGDRSLFLRFDEVEWAWRLLDPVLKSWENGSPDAYAAGSEGPESQNAILNPGHHWRRIGPPEGSAAC